MLRAFQSFLSCLLSFSRNYFVSIVEDQYAIQNDDTGLNKDKKWSKL